MPHPAMNKLLLIGCIVFACLLQRIKSQCNINSQYDVQLSSDGVFSNTVHMGRVEICICSYITTDFSACEWQTISTGSAVNPMSWKNSMVVCRELGYEDVQSPILQNTVRTTNLAPNSVLIYNFTFNCDGTESALRDCETGSSTSGLTHAADAYVHCQSSVTNGKIRLTGSTTDDRGIVEYYLDGDWRTVCTSGWFNEASLFCRSLGFDSGTATIISVFGHRGTNIGTAQYISFFTCPSTAFYFSSCTPDIVAPCNDANFYAGVTCSSNDTVQQGSVRRFYTDSSYQRVEVFYDGRWGTVCGSSWDRSDGRVACRELGGDADGVSTSTTTYNSVPSRPIWISGYFCNGSENSLSECNRVSNYPVGFYFTSSCLTKAGINCPAITASEDEGGLSGGAIAGIVIGSIVFIGLIGLFIKVQDDKKKKRAAAAAAARSNTNNVVLQQLQTTPTPATQTTTTINPEPIPDDTPTSSDPTLTQAPPPAYNEALKHMDVAQPPQYSNEEKKVPYPTASSNNDPAYPSAPPSNNDYQGYPPPTQPPGFGTNLNPPPPANPYSPSPPTNNPYPPSANPYPPSTNPYPTAPPPSFNPYPPSTDPYPPPPGSNVPYPT